LKFFKVFKTFQFLGVFKFSIVFGFLNFFEETIKLNNKWYQNNESWNRCQNKVTKWPKHII